MYMLICSTFQVYVQNGLCFYGPRDWQIYAGLAVYVLDEYPSEVEQSNVLLQVETQDPVSYGFEITNSAWIGPTENEEFICICYDYMRF